MNSFITLKTRVFGWIAQSQWQIYGVPFTPQGSTATVSMLTNWVAITGLPTSRASLPVGSTTYAGTLCGQGTDFYKPAGAPTTQVVPLTFQRSGIVTVSAAGVVSGTIDVIGTRTEATLIYRLRFTGMVDRTGGTIAGTVVDIDHPATTGTFSRQVYGPQGQQIGLNIRFAGFSGNRTMRPIS